MNACYCMTRPRTIYGGKPRSRASQILKGSFISLSSHTLYMGTTLCKALCVLVILQLAVDEGTSAALYLNLIWGLQLPIHITGRI